jgi:hypothetical protein
MSRENPVIEVIVCGLSRKWNFSLIDGSETHRYSCEMVNLVLCIRLKNG